MPHVIIGTAKTPVSWAEWFVSILPPGTPVRWQGRPQRWGPTEAGVGIFRQAWSYDGIMADVDVAGKRVTVPAYQKGLRIRRLRDTRLLTGPGIHGDGI